MSKLIVKDNKSAKNKARVATTITALIVFLCLYFVTFSRVDKWTTKRKKPQEKGVIINFGSTDKGMGTVQKQELAENSDRAQKATELVSEKVITPSVENTKVELPEKKLEPTPKPNKKTVPPVAQKKPTPKKKVVTQKKETKKIISSKEKAKKPEKKPVTKQSKSKPKPKAIPTSKPKEKEPAASKPIAKPTASETTKSKSTVEENGTEQQKATPTINNRALYPGKKKVNSEGEGTTNTAGDQGVQNGSEKKGRYTGTVSGTGTSGVKHTIVNRKLIKKPNVQDQSNVQGKITVHIKVGRDGKVLSASLGTPTTISDHSILQKTLLAAKQAKFDANPRADIEQFGQMTFIYTVR